MHRAAFIGGIWQAQIDLGSAVSRLRGDHQINGTFEDGRRFIGLRFYSNKAVVCLAGAICRAHPHGMKAGGNRCANGINSMLPGGEAGREPV